MGLELVAGLLEDWFEVSSGNSVPHEQRSKTAASANGVRLFKLMGCLLYINSSYSVVAFAIIISALAKAFSLMALFLDIA